MKQEENSFVFRLLLFVCLSCRDFQDNDNCSKFTKGFADNDYDIGINYAEVGVAGLLRVSVRGTDLGASAVAGGFMLVMVVLRIINNWLE